MTKTKNNNENGPTEKELRIEKLARMIRVIKNATKPKGVFSYPEKKKVEDKKRIEAFEKELEILNQK